MADDTDSPKSVGDADDGSGAIRAMAMLMTAIESGAGITYYDEERDDGVTNEQIIQWQADGVRRRDRLVKRDIRPNADDERKAAEAFEKRFQAALNREMKQKARADSGGRKKRYVHLNVNSADKDESLALLSSSLRAAGKVYAESYIEKWAELRDTAGRPLESVEAKYALRRARKYQMAENVILQRTGQLGRGIVMGRFRIWFDRSKVKEIVSTVKEVGNAANTAE